MLEDGAVMFDLAQSKYSISGEHNKCLLHMWSAERNTVRRVLDAEVKNGTLRLAVQRLGQARPTKLEICRERDRRIAFSQAGWRGRAYRAQIAAGDRAAISRICDCAADHRRGSGEIVWSDLCPGLAAARAVGLRGAGSECDTRPRARSMRR